MYCLYILVTKHTSYGVNIAGFMFILSVIRTSEEDIVVLEPPGVGGVTMSAI